METSKRSRSGKRTGNETPQTSVELRNDVNLRKVCDVSVKANVQTKPVSHTFVQALLRTEKNIFESEQNDEWNKMIASYMKNENEKLKYLRKCEKFVSPEEILTGSYSENRLETCDKGTYYQSLRSLCSNKENFQELQRGSSKVRMLDDEEVNPEGMIEIIQRDLKILMDMSPSVIKLATALSETLSHYKECLRCSEKISSSLPRIFNRIQKLVEYVSTKRQATYLRPSDYRYLKSALKESIFKKPEEIKNSASSELKSDLLSNKLGKQIELSEKVNATDIAEGRPGIQIALRFKSNIKEKRYFDQADQRFLPNFCESFPTVHLKESFSASIIQIVKPSPKPQVFWDKKNIILSPKKLFYAYHQVFALPSIIAISILVIIPVVRIRRIENTKRTLYHKPVESCEERILPTKKNIFTSFIHPGRKRSNSKADRSGCFQTQHPNEKKSFAERLSSNAPGIAQNFLKEAEEEKMQVHKMKELELEVKQLKDLILEVHNNQRELGKVVVEEGLYSQLIMKLTDPNMLEEESLIIKKLAEGEEFGKKSSAENLQTTVDYVKQRCTLKNRMIMTLAKCLRSNVYKKWWEEIMNSTFDESRPIEKFSREKMTKLLQQTSLFLVQDKEDSKESLEKSRSEEQNSEEEANMKEIIGTNFPLILSYQDKKLVKTKGCMQLSNTEELPSCPSRMKILAFPVTNVPENMNSLIRKLESQISLLSMENDRLWHEVHELRDLLKDSMKCFQEKRLSSASSGYKLSDKIKTSGKTINLTIQIGSEKDFRNINDSPYQKAIKNSESFLDSDVSEVSKSSSNMKYTVTESEANENETDPKKSCQDQNFSDSAIESKFRSKFKERRPENDLNYLSDLPPTFSSEYSQENEKLKTILREKNFIKEQKRSTQKLTMSTPHPSNQDMQQNLKSVLRVPSKFVIPEVISCHQAGPSHRPVDFRCLLQNPSRTKLTENQSLGMFATMANERELQTIPEHDQDNSNCSSNLSKDVSQAIQYLRARVRSIHKDVTVLKSKNDRIDKMLDRLIDDAVDSNKNLDEIGDDLNNFKNQLG